MKKNFYEKHKLEKCILKWKKKVKKKEKKQRIETSIWI